MIHNSCGSHALVTVALYSEFNKEDWCGWMASKIECILQQHPPAGTKHSSVQRWPWWTLKGSFELTLQCFSQATTSITFLTLYNIACWDYMRIYAGYFIMYKGRTQFQKHLHNLIHSNRTAPDNRVLLYHKAQSTPFWHVVNMKYIRPSLLHWIMQMFVLLRQCLCSFWRCINIFGGRGSRCSQTRCASRLDVNTQREAPVWKTT